MKKILLLGTALCNLFTIDNFLVLLIKKFLIKSRTFLKFLNSTFAQPRVSNLCQLSPDDHDISY